MKPMLDDLVLPQVQVVRSYDKRMLAEHRATNMDGSFLQNMGRKPSCLMLAGIASGDDALSFVEQLDDKFNAGEPVTFITDIIVDADIEQMLIDDFKLEELAGKPNRFAYVLTLREHIEPLEPEDVSALNSDILDDANSLLEDLVAGLDLGLSFPTGLEQFIEPLGSLLGRLRAFNQSVNQSNIP
jgi:hypothetical protein